VNQNTGYPFVSVCKENMIIARELQDEAPFSETL
jgi:hypothetical protein